MLVERYSLEGCAAPDATRLKALALDGAIMPILRGTPPSPADQAPSACQGS
jgi:hypothetical protein